MASEIVVATVATPGIGGQGWMTAYEQTVEYSSQDAITLSYVAADVNNGSYAPNPIQLPSTGGQITKFTTKLSPSKWKLLQAQFAFTDPQAQIYLAGTGISIKSWGSNSEFKFTPLFGGAADGGRGPQE